MCPMMKDTPHVRLMPANIESVVQNLFTDRTDEMHCGYVVRDVSNRNVCARPQKIDGDKLP